MEITIDLGLIWNWATTNWWIFIVFSYVIAYIVIRFISDEPFMEFMTDNSENAIIGGRFVVWVLHPIFVVFGLFILVVTPIIYIIQFLFAPTSKCE
jgi:hypothetical protein